MAIITVSNSGGTRNWTDPLTWVGGSVPLATDSVIFTNTSGNLIINATSTIVDFNLSNFTGTITFTGALIINGNWHLGGGIYTYTQLGTSYVRKQGTGTITSNGVTWSREFRFVGNGTTTLVDDLNLTGPFQFQGSSNPANMVVNGNNIFHTGTYIASINGGTISGTTKYWYQGTGTVLSQSISSFSINIDFYINTVGTFTISGSSTNGIVFGGNKELKVISGTLVTTGLSALTLWGRTIDFNGNTIHNLRLINATQTVTLLSTTTVNTLTIHQSPSVTQNITGFAINTNNLSITGTGNSASKTQGDTQINLVGSGTWSQTGTSYLKNNLTVKSTANLTVSGTVYYNTGILAAESGCIVNTGVSTLNVNASTTIDTNTYITWFNVNFSLVATHTFNSIFKCVNLMCGNGNITLNGFSIQASGNCALSTSVSVLTGSTEIILTGNGTLTTPVSTGRVKINLTIDTLGSITISGTIKYGGNFTFRILNGTVNASTSTLSVGGSALETTGLDLSSTTFGTFNVSGATINYVILSSPLYTTNYTLTSGSAIVNGNPIVISGNITLTASAGNSSSGNAMLIIVGTGTWSTLYNVSIRNNINIDTLGTLTIIGNVYYRTGILNYNQGTVDTAGSTLNITGSATLNTNGSTLSTATTTSSTGINFNSIIFTAVSITLTNNSPLCIISNLTINASNINDSTGISGASTYLLGNLYIPYTGAGSSKIIFNGLGSQSWTHAASGTMPSGGYAATYHYIINKPSGTLTFGAQIGLAINSILEYTQGIVDTTTNNTTLYIRDSCILNTNGINWNNIVITNATITNNSLLTCNSLTLGGLIGVYSGIVTFSGTSGFTTGTLSVTTAGRIITLASGITYNVTSNLNLVGTVGSKITLRTLTTPRAIFTLPYGATRNVQNTNATNIDSSLGQTIYSSTGTLTNTINWSIGSGSNSGNFFIMF